MESVPNFIIYYWIQIHSNLDKSTISRNLDTHSSRSNSSVETNLGLLDPIGCWAILTMF